MRGAVCTCMRGVAARAGAGIGASVGAYESEASTGESMTKEKGE